MRRQNLPEKINGAQCLDNNPGTPDRVRHLEDDRLAEGDRPRGDRRPDDLRDLESIVERRSSRQWIATGC